MPNRLFAIGDIHGCSTALSTLIGTINPQSDDTIVVLGDVIDYGPDTRGAVQQLIDLSARCQLILLMGNHEEMLFKAARSHDDLRYWLDCGGVTTRRSYPDQKLIDPEHFRFLKQHCRVFHETDGFIFVHANYIPDQPMSKQSDQSLRWDAIQPDRTAPHVSGKPVVAGHTRLPHGKVRDLGFLVMIDTDPTRVGWLTALEVNSGEIFQANQRGEIRKSVRTGTEVTSSRTMAGTRNNATGSSREAEAPI
ncbi:serine/threonine protein phosphatase 1 [Singulisphaera sp. GP187]|uniref:metallophosphoesterase n=1 Tax=Singulisphaera sp. GP187 TaxID=1882752 RepID=UPI000927D029|nr:metallophosphoesterase [Singulisphaera sp. GP187]SIO63209.1 serine/threonine protein phosphatase 1 [Singulisphaera sp. GP187]